MPFSCLSFGFVGFRCVFGLLKKENKGKASLMASIDIYTESGSDSIVKLKTNNFHDYLRTHSKLIDLKRIAKDFLKGRSE